jgi:hypothetical protein
MDRHLGKTDTSCGRRRLAGALVAALLGVPPGPAGLTVGMAVAAEKGEKAEQNSSTFNLGRFAVPRLEPGPAKEVVGVMSFNIVLLIPPEQTEDVRLYVPAYRDAVIGTSFAYAAFVARNRVSADPQKLGELILRRIRTDTTAPVPLFVTLANFQEADPRSRAEAPPAPQ